ncbi:hypothetical protein [Actinomycetospora chiangmaiensis]|uniref:hypothetical protein n=1 Tax=Actinomycetospora chiangmaiensis TaxID=402650 RepID=UPI001B7FDE91|nr:hypothetical protein [Actinomycetospora chiangmaiensis]
MEPEDGHEVAFHQWYADDHFYAGGMNLPGIFAGRRWVCPREHQALRYARENSTFQPAQAGRFLHLNLFARGQVDDTAEVLGEAIARLAGEGRMYVDTIRRRHVFSRLQPYAGVVYAAPHEPGPLDIHALDHPFAGVVLEVVRTAAGQSRQALVDDLRHDVIPSRLGPAGAELCLVCLDADLPEAVSRKTARVPSAYGDAADERISLLWFVHDDPREDWEERFAPHRDALDDRGLGYLEFASPFVPTVPGTDRHVDDLGER